MNRAYSVVEMKTVDEASRKFSGVASTPSTDRMGDVVEPKGAEFKLPIPLLWQHRSDDPIGWVTKAKVTSKGIEIEGEIANVSDEGELKGRLTKAWQMIKAGLVRGLSIGFNSIESARIENSYGIHFQKWEWLELSAVTIPANQEATITAVKSFDRKHLAASGNPIPGVTGKQKRYGNMKTIHEQLIELEEMCETKNARMREITEVIESEGRTFNDDEAAEFDSLDAEVKDLESQIRVKKVQARSAATAKSVSGENQRSSSMSRGPDILIRKQDPDDKFQGQSFVRRAIAKALAHMSHGEFTAGQIAEARWGKSNPQLVQWIKTDISAASSTDAAWAGRLVTPDSRFTGDFIEYLKSMTVFDRLPLKEVPANVTIKGQDGISTAYWGTNGAAIGVSEQSFTTVNLAPRDINALAVITNQVIRDSSPAAEALVRDGLAESIREQMDKTFLSTANVVGDAPAGILYNVSPGSATGADSLSLRRDIGELYSTFLGAKNASGLYVLMSPTRAKQISLMIDALGREEFPSLSAVGGTLLGDTVLTGDEVNDSHLILLKPSDIWRIGDTGIQVSISQDATIEMEDGPEMNSVTPAPVGSGHKFVNMFQTNSTAFKVTRSVNYAKRRSGCVQYISDAAYGIAPVETT